MLFASSKAGLWRYSVWYSAYKGNAVLQGMSCLQLERYLHWVLQVSWLGPWLLEFNLRPLTRATAAIWVRDFCGIRIYLGSSALARLFRSVAICWQQARNRGCSLHKKSSMDLKLLKATLKLVESCWSYSEASWSVHPKPISGVSPAF